MIQVLNSKDNSFLFHRIHFLWLMPILLSACGVGGGDIQKSQPENGVFTYTGDLVTAHYYHTATTLPDGKVLIVGGPDQDVTAELYVPLTGTFSLTGSLTKARGQHTATLLPSGKVLIAGGNLGPESIKYPFFASEIYDPDSGEFSVSGLPVYWLTVSKHTATLLSDGKVLIVGGYDMSRFGATASCWLYDPQYDTLTGTGKLIEARFSHTATLLPDGNVLIAGGEYIDGSNATKYIATAEIYNPKTGTFSLTSNMSQARGLASATLLTDGRVFIAGGRDEYTATATAEYYNPTMGVFTDAGNMRSARSAHSATLLPDGSVLLAGGRGNSSQLISSAEIFGPQTGDFKAVGDLNTARELHTASLLPSGKVLIAAGRGPSALAEAEIYDPASE